MYRHWEDIISLLDFVLQKDKIIKELIGKNKKLQDEVNSLWMMLDEMTKSDIEN